MIATETFEKIQIDDIEIAYKTWGDENAPLVLALHGWLDNADSFDKIAPGISKDKHVIAFDLAGHGTSSHRGKNASYHLWDYALDILKVIEQKKWKKFILLAHSMGTGVASILAAVKPKMVEKLIFIDGLGAPFVMGEDVVRHFGMAHRQMEMGKKLKMHGFSDEEKPLFKSKEEAIRERMNSVVSPLSFRASEVLVERSLRAVNGGYRWSFDPRLVIPECFRMTEKQACLFLQKIECDVLLVLGNKGLFSHIDYQKRIKCFVDPQIEWLDGGHHLHLEEASFQIELLINDFIKTNN